MLAAVIALHRTVLVFGLGLGLGACLLVPAVTVGIVGIILVSATLLLVVLLLLIPLRLGI
jgi:hypothetical protein